MQAIARAEAWMQLALEQARIAYAADEVPVGAVIVSEDRLISSGYNQCISSCDPSAHAEIVALRAAARELANYRLTGTQIYISCEPCLMCLGALANARIKQIYFACPEPKTGALVSAYSGAEFARRHKISWHGGILAASSAQLMRDFFQQRRG